VRLGSDLDDRVPDRDPAAGRQLPDAQVQVDEELVARELPPIDRPGDESD
jgi:hypothetical protein